MKFDGVVENSPDRETFGDPLGYGAMEYVYYLMATRCGIDMEECFLLNEGPRRHFISKRFDRDSNKKIHTQTLTAIAHADYNTPGSFSYEELFATARELKLPVHDAPQLFIRMSFNMLTRNNDDHSKNFSFVYRHKSWRLSPAYDVAYCYKANNARVERHWMPANGKRIDHNRGDLISVGRNMTRIPVSELHQLIDEVIESVNCWDALALEYEVPADLRKEISDNLPISDFKK